MKPRRMMTQELEEALVALGASFLRLRAAAPSGRDFERRAAQMDIAAERCARIAVAAGFGRDG